VACQVGALTKSHPINSPRVALRFETAQFVGWLQAIKIIANGPRIFCRSGTS
jgi:hypothetical protein